MQKLSFLTIVILMTFGISFAQQKYSISGKVTQKSSGEAVFGANVYIKGTTLGGATNKDGEFYISGVRQGEAKLVVSFSGLKRVVKVIDVNSSLSPLEIQMEESKHELGEIVVTATGTPHHLKNAPIATEVIKSKQIETVHANDLQSALTKLNPSFSFQPSIMGQYLNVNGLSNNFVLILVDGKRVSGDISGNTDLNRINTTNIDHIEIVKGASSSLYGSDAMGAVINIITKKPKNKLDINSYTKFSKYGELVNSNNINIKLGRVTSTTSFTHKEQDAYQLNELDTKGKKTDKMVVYDSKDNTISQNLSWALTDRLELNANGSFYKRELDYYESSKYDFEYEDLNYGLGAKYLLNKTNYITLNAYSDRFEYSKVYQGVSSDSLVLTQRQFNNTVSASSFFKLSQNNRLIAGAEFRKNELKSGSLPKDGGDNYGVKTDEERSVWVQDEWNVLKDLTFVFGGRYTDHDAFGGKFTPKAAVMYKFNDFRARFNYANGYKTPTLKELHYYYKKRSVLSIGNSDLNPQSSNYFGLTFEYSKSFFSASITGYQNYLKDMIYKKNISDQLTTDEKAAKIKKKYVYSNVGKATTKGFDINLSAKLGMGFNLLAAYSYVDAEGRENKDDDYKKLERVSPHAATLMLSYDKQFCKKYKLNVSVDGRYEDEKHFDDGNSEDYQIWNFNTNHTLLVSKQFDMIIGAGVKNIFDYTDDSVYGSNYSTLDPGRRVYVSLKFNFKM